MSVDTTEEARSRVIQIMKVRGMSTNYTILLFYITAEAATGSILGKKMLFKNSCSEICRVKVLAKYI